MDEHDWLAKRFEEHRAHMRNVAYRILGSPSEADDAVQAAWLRLSRSDVSTVENMRGWLTTVVAHVSLNMLSSRKSRREEPLELQVPAVLGEEGWIDPEHEAVLADSIGLAMLVVLETLTPPERVAFVLHDIFDLPFDEIAPIVGRSSAAARQLASRARHRVQGATIPDADLRRRREVVEAFLAAARGGDFEALLALLDPEVVLRADTTAVSLGASREVRKPAGVADFMSRRARTAQLALVNGVLGVVWAPGGRTRVVFDITISGEKIVAIDLIADPDLLHQLDLVLLHS
jgi:RNA polymerase sigma factor (sigma-70 family)